ncbi:MAG TPA: ferritin-like domain-containing protein [Actinocrinis sp.]|nr:ferritin-like domain-containing protein [Actinocrinis sp.]
MLSAANLLREIHDDDETFRLFCSIAMQGERQGGWENGRIAALVSDQDLAPKIARHGADEDKHGRIFRALLRRRGLEPVDVPAGANYTMLLEQQGIGLAHDRLRRDEQLTDQDVITYLVHSRVTEQRAAEQMGLLRKVFGDDPDVGRAVRLICADEDNHLAYCHEELLRLADRGERARIARLLRRTARAEIRTYRDVSLVVMAQMGRLLHWSRARRALLALGIRAVYLAELLVGWRRMVTLTSPARRNALGGSALRDPSLEY